MVIVLIGSLKIWSLHIFFEEGIVAENKMMELAGAGVSDVQDDFRTARYNVKHKYSEDHLKKELFGSNISISRNESKMFWSEYINKIKEDQLFLKQRKDIMFNGNLKEIYKLKSENKERIYYFLYKNIYHNTYFCSHMPESKSLAKIYSSIEECALSGGMPCKKCVLGLE